jgi:hypothetical protein
MADDEREQPNDSSGEAGAELFAGILAELERTVLDACAVPSQWPAQIAAGVYAGVDFAIANPARTRAWSLGVAYRIGSSSGYEAVISRLADLLRARAPSEARLPASTDEALVAGIVGLVGDHVRSDRLDRLAELRPELVLLTLLPYLGFAEAKRWADLAAGISSENG